MEALNRLKTVQADLEELELFLETSNSLTTKLLSTTKLVFDSMIGLSKDGNESSGLHELIVAGLDDEQIWQEIELENSVIASTFFGHVGDVVRSNDFRLSKEPGREVGYDSLAAEEIGVEPEEKYSDSELGDDSSSEVGGVEEKEQDKDKEQESNEPCVPIAADLGIVGVALSAERNVRRKKKSEVLDDEFFKLADMNKYADADSFPINGQEDSEEEIDYFSTNVLGEQSNDDLEDELAKAAKYSDYFDPPASVMENRQKQNKAKSFDDEDINDLLAEDDEEGSEQSDEVIDKYFDGSEAGELTGEDEKEGETTARVLSQHEKTQAKLNEKIKQLEEANLEERPWQEKGEADAKHRPVNSLLEEDLQFQHTSIGGPVITEETTLKLEDILKQRIKDQAWDDVVRKAPRVLDKQELRKEAPLNEDKSKLSLAEIYEKEYIKSTEKSAQEEKDEENEDHKAIRGMMKRLFAKLDALSNFHYTPKPVKEDLQIITNVPTIQMEEVAPTMVSETRHLAPEEVYTKHKSDIKGKSERSTTDKKRERRTKKLTKKKEAAEKKKGENGNRKNLNIREKKEILKSLSKNRRTTVLNRPQDDKHLKSSSAVFARLQDEAKNYVKSKSKERKGKEKSEKKAVASGMKL